MPIGAIIGAGASLLGGLLNKSAQDESNRINAEAAANNIAHQKEFAQSGIQWKVADAEKAGIHPLFALGANTHSFAPVSVGHSPSTGLGDALPRMGQDISRAVHASSPQAVRERMVANSITDLQLERGKLENDLLRTQIASATTKLMSAQIGPPMPTPNDSTFPIATKPPEKNPRDLYVRGYPVRVDPHTSSMKDIEDVYGDDGPQSWVPKMMVGLSQMEYAIRNAELRRRLHGFVGPQQSLTGNWSRRIKRERR